MDTAVLENLLCDLTAIDSTNPELVPGGAGEYRIAGFVAEWLRSADLDVRIDDSIAGRPSVIAVAHGTGGGRNLLLNGHMDVVGAGGMTDPFVPTIRNGKLYGRGSYDMKGGLAACMAALKSAREGSRGRRLRGDLILAAVADEEYGGRGTMGAVSALAREGIRVDGALVAEGTDERLITTHKGFVWREVRTFGTAAHGSRPDLGVDAIVSMGHFLARLDDLNRDLMGGKGHSLLGTGSVHASLVRGGQEFSTYPGECLLSIERRTIPGETGGTAQAELERIIDSLSETDGRFRARSRGILERGPLETRADSPLVRFFLEAAKRAAGMEAQIVGAPYWTDAATLHEAGIPAVLFGPRGAGAHADEEWVDLESVGRCAAIYSELAGIFCGMEGEE